MKSQIKSKKIVVIGAGIIGLTTAYKLATNGYAVTVIDQHPKPAGGTSHANAGQLIYNFGAMGSPAFLRTLPMTLLNPKKHGVIAGELYNPKNWPWALSFMRECTSRSWQRNSEALINMAHKSRDGLTEFMKHHDVDFKWRTDGKIITYEAQQDLKAAKSLVEFQRAHGGGHRIITREECMEREPALKGATRKFAGGIHIPEAAVGDCRLFCEQLSDILKSKYDTKLIYNTKIDQIICDQNHVQGLMTSQGIIEADTYVVCGALESLKLLPKSFPSKKPMMAIKGISLTYPIGTAPPNLSVTDSAGKFAMVRLGDKIRIAGYAIFSNNLNINDLHVNLLHEKAKSLMPNAADYKISPKIWTGLRPQTPDDIPMIGNAGAKNLFINAGHGSNGWILSFGAAEKLLEKINE